MSLSDELVPNKGNVIAATADCEVQKLKDLVKKLERQNQHLRYKTGKLSPHTREESSCQKLDGIKIHNSDPPSQNSHLPEDCIPESDILKLDLAGDTAWLYASPKLKNTEDKHSLEVWLRGELDHPATPQLAMAKRSIMNTLDSPYGYEIFKSDGLAHETALPYLSSAAKPLYDEGPQNNYTDSLSPVLQYKNISHQLFPANEDSPHSAESHSEVFHSPKHRSHSSERDSASGHQVHHMPLPSHTMTSAHGLVPSGSMPRHRQRSPSPRSRNINHTSTRDSPASHYTRGESPTRRSRMKTSLSEKTSLTPRSQSPASIRTNIRSMPDMQRGRSASPRPEAVSSHSSQSGKSKSSISRLGMSGLPRSHSPAYGINSSSDGSRLKPVTRQIRPPSRTVRSGKGSYSELNSESLPTSQSTSNVSRSLTPRRSLPRPSQASRSQYQTPNSKLSSESVKKSSTTPNFAGERNKQELYASPCGSESGSSDVWKDGEFF